jgi:SAM-dependent methyltransferase
LHEILEHLPPGARVLDLGCRDGSFTSGDYPFLTVRADLNQPKLKACPFVQADAVRLPFPSGIFDAVILNHCVEHFVQLKPALQEIGRVIKPDGAAFVAVPDASTLSDRLYRKVFRSRGGHVNLFDSSQDLESMLSWYFGLPHVATRTLHSSLSFLNRRNTRDPKLRWQMRFGGFWEPVLARVAYATQLCDRWFGTRFSVYGWAFYFGRIGEEVDRHPLPNVCIRCGQAHPQHALEQAGCVRKRLFGRWYQYPDCGALNRFIAID